MDRSTFDSKAADLEAQYPDMSRDHMDEAGENVWSFDLPKDKYGCPVLGEEYLEAYASCLGGTYEQYYR